MYMQKKFKPITNFMSSPDLESKNKIGEVFQATGPFV